MNDEGHKVDAEEPVDSAAAEASNAAAPQPASDEPVGEPVPSKPDEEAVSQSDPDVMETAASDDTVMDAPASAGDAESNAEADEDVEDELDDEEDEQDEASVASPAGPVELDLPEEEDVRLDWYILKVQSNRERSIADALRRKIAIEGLDHLFGQVLVPTEKVTEFKGGKKKIVERKLWPGYIAVEMHVNDDTWFAIRETSGIGDFTGSAGKPTPMEPSEVAMILQSDVEETEEAPKLDIKFSPGDKVKVMEGNFENFEGEVSSIDETHGRVTVMLSIFGRPTPVELEYWQVEGL
ncbi:transcription termination/antitermination protein NusG [Aeoliella straminimaris]|uniref:transcription termination/antitermination protein NusG n=1 Tax=Aeoliella straminimaris TaxID=2954799 RepID=UPI0020928312